MQIRTLVLTAALTGLMATAASAQDSAIAVDVHGGTTGIGIGARYQVSDSIVLRADYDTLKHSDDFSSDGVNYNGEVEFKPFTFAVNAHPFKNSFFVSAGYVMGDRNIKLDARPAGPTQVGSVTYQPGEIGTLRANADMGDGAPFIGLGFDNTFHSNNRITFRFLAGAVLGDEPSVTLTSDGSLATNAAYKTQLEIERKELEQDVKDVKTWPVLQLGLSYKF
ncbi:hypothetical protein PQU92_04740 [Asticcacaulis sp. BYS171W]|uniref:Outer membrane protein n=1 Tax=Asticcacaulis aquaticus TaxID=2984212 RepID=A0ABT5HRF8_9CAUL|nr:hypothetical protein [Asticcacaulis aquaticus]MDC7682569.1 hypothetical protein [Asticcacaulis aquaticus]